MSTKAPAGAALPLSVRAFAYLRQNQPREALALLREGVREAPRDAAAWQSLGAVALGCGRAALAARALRRAAGLLPDDAGIWLSLGQALRQSGGHVAARDALERAAALAPARAAAWRELAAVCQQLRLFQRQAYALRQLAALEPQDAGHEHALGLALCYSGHARAGIRAFRRAIRLDPGFDAPYSCLAMGLQMLPEASPARVFRAHCDWPAAVPATAIVPGPRRHAGPLRVGYVSGQLFDCSAAFFLEPLLHAHDPHSVRAYCYSSTARTDAVTRRLRQAAACWRDISELDDQAAAEAVARDRIDILVDLDGHANGNRLGLFAGRAAPVQVTYLGYPNTSGLRQMDYRVTDSACDPPEATERFHTETLLRLDPCFLTYRPPADAPEPSPLPAGARRPFTFGCFAAMPKLHEESIAVYASILRQVPDARLLMKNRALAEPASVARIERLFRREGVDASRLRLLSFIPNRGSHLALYGEVDLALDSFPYAGTTTTCEALWMGVPVVSLVGQTHVQRVGLTLLQQAGLPQLATDSREEFIRTAVAWAADRGRLARVRRGLRRRLQASALLDAVGHARRFEALLQSIVRCGV
ncbi:MAG: hypothetical protein IT162_15395 [Bryobacterales bacterium]|nr:hypothetical protein [Bryobacterales bacterium]